MASRVDDETQANLKQFFELYDPQRLELADFSILLKYVEQKGLPALEVKLLEKYGVNLSTMQKEMKRGSVDVGVRAKSLNRKKEKPSRLQELERRKSPQNPIKKSPSRNMAGINAKVIEQKSSKGSSSVSKSNSKKSRELSRKQSHPVEYKSENGRISRASRNSPSRVEGRSVAGRSGTQDDLLSHLEGPGGGRTSHYGFDELDALPPAPPVDISGAAQTPYLNTAFNFDSEATRGRQSRAVHSHISVRKAADLLKEDSERMDIYVRLQAFYREFNPQKVHKGFGEVVEYGLAAGIGNLNAKLFKTYGYDLDSFEAGKHLQKHVSDQVRDPDVAMLGRMEAAAGATGLRERLVRFFLQVDPERAQFKMDPLLRYAKKNTFEKLDLKLKQKYGVSMSEMELNPDALHESTYVRPDLESPQPVEAFLGETSNNGVRELPEYVKTMLYKYYAKYDPIMLNGGVEAVYGWTERNGLQRLNDQLLGKYGQSFQEFVQSVNDLRDDLIDFYKLVDKNKLVTGIKEILDWGIRNGRTALNMKLIAKYQMDLDYDKDENWTSASQV